MSLPKALVHSTYRALAKHARVFDQSAAKRTLIAAAPTRFFVHEYETWVDVERSSDWDGARAAVDEYIRRANRGKEMYLPPHPDDTNRSRHPLLDLIRDSYRSRPNTSAAFSEAFSAVRLFTSARERTKDLPSELPHSANGGGFELTTIGDDGVWHHADPAAQARIIVANPLLPGIFAHSIVCMIPPPPPPSSTAEKGVADGDAEDSGGEPQAAAPSATPKTANSSQLQGATGFIVNKPLLNDQGVPVPIWAAFPGDSPALFTETLANNVVMVGGPVGAIGNRETAVFVIHRVPGVPDAVPVAPGVWSSYRSLEALDERIRADKVDVKDVMVVVGYAGWGNSQLGGEIENGSWFVANKSAASAPAETVGEFLFSSNLVMPPSDGNAADTETPVIENPEKAWCQLLASWGDDHADLTRLATIHKSRRPSDTASW